MALTVPKLCCTVDLRARSVRARPNAAATLMPVICVPLAGHCRPPHASWRPAHPACPPQLNSAGPRHEAACQPRHLGRGSPWCGPTSPDRPMHKAHAFSVPLGPAVVSVRPASSLHGRLLPYMGLAPTPGGPKPAGRHGLQKAALQRHAVRSPPATGTAGARSYLPILSRAAPQHSAPQPALVFLLAPETPKPTATPAPEALPAVPPPPRAAACLPRGPHPPMAGSTRPCP